MCPGLSEAYRRDKVLVVEAATGEAVGLTMADLPPEIAATDPGLVSCDWFYVIATADQRGDVPALFVERLMAATYHTILPEWGSYLFKAGLKKKLVTDLPILGQPDDFSRALRVERCPEGWQAILSQGLRDGKLKF